MEIDLEQPSGDHHKDREGNGVDMFTNAGNFGSGVCSQHGVTDGALWVARYGTEKGGANITESTFNNKDTVVDVNKGAGSSYGELEPYEGMEFESKDDAFSFYKEYAKYIGFSTITKASRRSRISGNFIDAKFVCTRYGTKRESGTSETPKSVSEADSTSGIPVKRKRGRINESWKKTDCKACMHVKRRQDGRWIVHTLVKEHNHQIFPDQAYSFEGHRNRDLVNNHVNALNANRARIKKMHTTMCGLSGEMKVLSQNIGSTGASGRHLALEEGDAQALLEHFLLMQDDNPNFFYAIDLDQEQHLRNVFWVDPKARFDYRHFNDVVLFDTTYIKNEYKLPFASFIGVNHHFQFLLLGCALIANESKSTYIWLMKAWLRAMGGQAPKVMLTNQDTILQRVIAEILPDSHNCFCLWHIFSKIQEKLGNVIRKHDSFISKFDKCILKSATDELFEKRWWKVVDRFDLRNDLWIQSLYEDRQRWVPTYMKEICLAGMSTTQRLENISSFLDRCIQRRTTMKEFLDQYKRMLQEKYEDEAKADFETWHKHPGLKSPSPFGKQMSVVYTHTIFRKFQGEVLGVVACHPRKESENGAMSTFKVQDFEEKQEFFVTWNEGTADTSCSCHFFEYNGFLCRHVMIVLQMSGVHSIPSKYILKRWTKNAKRTETMRHDDMIQSRVQRYDNLCQQALKLGDEGSLSQESYHIAFKALEEALRKCEIVSNSIKNLPEPSSPIRKGLNDFEKESCYNYADKTEIKNRVARKGKVNCVFYLCHAGHKYQERWHFSSVDSLSFKEQFQEEVINLGMPDGWQQMEHSRFQAPTLDYAYGSQGRMEGMGQLSSRVQNFDNYFSAQQVGQGAGQLNTTVPSHDEYYNNQTSMQGLGQLHFRPESVQNCFGSRDGLQHEQYNAGTTNTLGMMSKHLQLKEFPC